MSRSAPARKSPVARLLDRPTSVRPLRARAFRVVEGQHVVATRRLVDSRKEQELLEELIEDAKPMFPDREAVRGLHYLLSTPFRYPPLRHGSRFGTRAEPSLWYGSARPRTAFAETAYYRLLFLEGTTADLGPLRADFSIFDVRMRTRRGVDLSRGAFEPHRAVIASPERYDETQALGRAMREAGVECFRYPAARDRRGGLNLAAFTPRVFASPAPGTPETWHCVAERSSVEFIKKDPFDAGSFRFPRGDFLVRGELPAPAV